MEIFNYIATEFGPQLVLFVVIGIVISIYSDWLSPSEAFLSATIILIITGVLGIEDLLTSFSNKEVVTIFILIFITVAIQRNLSLLPPVLITHSSMPAKSPVHPPLSRHNSV